MQTCMVARQWIGTFRFYDKDENEYESWLPVFSENTKEIYNPYA